MSWNANGFNFYNADDLPNADLELKRGLTRFAGTIIWRSKITSDEVILSAIVNELIYARTQDIANNPALNLRLIKLIRVSGMIDEKRKILASMGMTLQDSEIAELIARRKLEHPMIHFGVQVESSAWADIVKNALSMSAVVTSLESNGSVCLNSFSRKISGAIAWWMCSGKHSNRKLISLWSFFFADGGFSAATLA